MGCSRRVLQLFLFFEVFVWAEPQRGVRLRPLDGCDQYAALYPPIFEQLAPFLGGITQSQVDKGQKLFSGGPSEGPSGAKAVFNHTAESLPPPSDPNFPWSHPFVVKVVSLDGTLYLPGGRIPANTNGFSFTKQWGSGYPLIDLLNVTDKFGPFPDMEFFVTSGDFPFVSELSDDNTTYPTFSCSGSKRFYDIALPESSTTWFFRDTDRTIDWSDRIDKVVGRYNLMCHRGGSSLTWRGSAEKKGCVRVAYHELDRSSLNRDGLIDVGIYKGLEEKELKPYVSSSDLDKAKFRLVLDGATTANRLPGLLRGGQLMMLEDHSAMFSHFYGALQPWVHYVPVGRDSYEDIFDVTNFLIRNDDIARQIAENGYQFGMKYLKPEASECYTRKLLDTLGSLVKYKPRPLGNNAITLREAIDLVEEDRISMSG